MVEQQQPEKHTAAQICARSVSCRVGNVWKAGRECVGLLCSCQQRRPSVAGQVLQESVEQLGESETIMSPRDGNTELSTS